VGYSLTSNIESTMALATSKEKIIQQIKQLYRKREPLNILGMKRNHPQLLRRVYAVHPFWGWKKAVEDAGIDYGKINVELLDYVTCQHCGEDFKQLISHLRDIHHTTGEDYREQFPNAELMSEQTRARKSFSLRRTANPPHWEPLWSDEYILDRIAELNGRGVDLDVSSILQHECPLHSAARNFIGSWDVALRRAGLDPKKIRRIDDSLYLSQKEIVAQLQARHKRGLPLNHIAVEREDLPFYSAIHRAFPSYDSALRAAGFDPVKVRRRPEAHGEAAAQNLLQEVRQAAVLPEKQRHRAWRKLVKQYLRVVKSRRFRSWSKVFAEAGVSRSLFPITGSCPENRVGVRFPTRRAVIKEFKRRLREGLPIHAVSILQQDRLLHRAAVKYFGSISEMCIHLKQPAIQPRSLRYPDLQAVLDALQRRHERGLPIDSQSINKADARLFQAIQKYLGGIKGVYKLYERPLFKRRQPKYTDKAATMKALRSRLSRSLSIKSAAVHADDPGLEGAVRRYFGSFPAMYTEMGVKRV
jgi:hypothetical protein